MFSEKYSKKSVKPKGKLHKYAKGGLVASLREEAADDRDEIESKKRFFDDGARLPGRQKARNDDYENSLKKR